MTDLSQLVVVLVSPRNPLNIGAVARAMTNFGASDLRLVKVHPPSLLAARSAADLDLEITSARSAADLPLEITSARTAASPSEAPASAVGPSAAIVTGAREFQSVAEAISDCAFIFGTVAPGHRPPSASYALLPDAAPTLRAHLQHSRVALLFGSEKFGLSNSDLSHCHTVLGIPTSSTLASMNLGQAAAVCLYELSRPSPSPSPARAAAPDTALSSETERLTTLLAETLALTGPPAPSPEIAEQELRALILRLNLSSTDAISLTGILRHILWKLRHPPA
jgi:tRNA/rRNA methyltransferase